MQHIEAAEVDVATVHHVDGSRLGKQHIKRVDIMQLAVRDVNETRDVAAQIKQSVHLHGGFGRTKPCPREHRQAQIDGRRIQCIDGVAKVYAQALTGIESPSLRDESVGELRVDPPVARLVASASVDRRTGSRKPM